MPYLTSAAFWAVTAERAVKTFAQALLAALTVAQTAAAVGVDVRAVNWATAAALAAGATVLSVLTSVASGPVGPPGSPSLVGDDRTTRRS